MRIHGDFKDFSTIGAVVIGVEDVSHVDLTAGKLFRRASEEHICY
jgi:hypothetical protein